MAHLPVASSATAPAQSCDLWSPFVQPRAVSKWSTAVVTPALLHLVLPLSRPFQPLAPTCPTIVSSRSWAAVQMSLSPRQSGVIPLDLRALAADASWSQLVLGPSV